MHGPIAPIVNNAKTAVNYSIVAAGAVTLNAAVGQAVLNVSLDGTSTAAATAVSISVTGAQTFNLASNGSFTTANSVGGHCHCQSHQDHLVPPS